MVFVFRLLKAQSDYDSTPLLNSHEKQPITLPSSLTHCEIVTVLRKALYGYSDDFIVHIFFIVVCSAVPLCVDTCRFVLNGNSDFTGGLPEE